MAQTPRCLGVPSGPSPHERAQQCRVVLSIHSFARSKVAAHLAIYSSLPLTGPENAEGFREILGEEHPDTLVAQANLDVLLEEIIERVCIFF